MCHETFQSISSQFLLSSCSFRLVCQYLKTEKKRMQYSFGITIFWDIQLLKNEVRPSLPDAVRSSGSESWHESGNLQKSIYRMCNQRFIFIHVPQILKTVQSLTCNLAAYFSSLQLDLGYLFTDFNFCIPIIFCSDFA